MARYTENYEMARTAARLHKRIERKLSNVDPFSNDFQVLSMAKPQALLLMAQLKKLNMPGDEIENAQK